MGKMMIFDDKARQKLEVGVRKLASAVRITMGPRGRNVVLEKTYGSPSIINDGVTIAREIDLDDPYENLGAQLVKEVAGKTNDIAGDGTTTATVLTHEIYKEGLKKIQTGNSPIQIKRGIDKAVAAVVESLRAMSKKVSEKHEIAQVATVSANGDAEIGNMIADAFARVGNDGVVTIEESKTGETTVETTDGMQFDTGFMSPYMVNNIETLEAVYENPYVLISAEKMDNIDAVLPIIRSLKQSSSALLIITDDISSDVLSILVANKMQLGIKIVAVKAPGYGDARKELMQDLAALTGATVLSPESGKRLTKDSKFETFLGSAKKVVVEKLTTTIIEGGGKPEAVETRCTTIKKQIENASDWELDKLKERLSKLKGGVAVLSVGASTETEMNEKKLRVEDALHATRAAVAEGIVPGGGVALIRARKAIKDLTLTAEEQLGADIIWQSVAAPLYQIATNSGISGDVAIDKVEALTGSFGLNAASGEYEDLIAAGVIDPTKVTRSALENAASIAGLMLTTECLVVKSPEKNKRDREEQGQED